MNGKELLSWNIRRLRVARGLSQEQLAVDAGVDRTYVGRVERGVENPSVGNLEKLAGALGAELVDLFRKPRAGEREPQPLPAGRKQTKAKTVSRRT
jgi:transcriptional regulator with XRE-family HTH domain